MQSLTGKITGDSLTAAEWNQLPAEVQNVITGLGQTLASGDLNQLGKSIAGYVANGDFYTDSGAANVYVLGGIGSKQTPTAYTDGFSAVFRAGNTNTGASTVNIAGLGVKNIKTVAGADPSAGDITAGDLVKLRYDLANGWFDFISTAVADASTTEKGIVELATDAEVAAGTDTDRAVVPSALAALFGASSQAASGYARIPIKIGGAIDEIIIQWGFSTATNAGSAVVFPIAFPTAAFVVNGGSAAVTIFVSAASVTTTGFIFHANTGSSGHFWVAIGH